MAVINLQVDSALNTTEQYIKDEDGNTSNLAIGKDGKVGIGTTDPGKELDVDGTIRIRDDAASKAMYLEPNGTHDSLNAHFLGTETLGGGHLPLALRVNSSNRLVIGTDGKTGIGTDDPDALLHVGGDFISKGPFTDIRAYSSFSAAITAIGTDEVTLVIPDNQSISSGDVTINKNITLLFIRGGKITFSNDRTLNVNGDLIADRHQIFDGSGTVVFGSGTANSVVTEVYPEWWGATGDGSTDDTEALENALATGINVKLGEGTYLVSLETNAYLTVIKGLIGIGDESELKLTGVSDHLIKLSADNAVLKDLKLNGNVVSRYNDNFPQFTAVCYGVIIRAHCSCLIENVTFTDFGVGNVTGDGQVDVGLRGHMICIESQDTQAEVAENNIIRNCRFLQYSLDDKYSCVSYAIRLFTNFNPAGNSPATWDCESDDGKVHYVRNNIIENCYIEGTSKNAIEIVGPNTINNKVLNCTIKNLGGYAGFDVDFGARYNTVKNCMVDGFDPISDIITSPESTSVLGYFTIKGFFCGYRYSGDADPCKGNRFINITVRNIHRNLDKYVYGMYVYGSLDTTVDNAIFEDLSYDNDSSPNTKGYGLLLDRVNRINIKNIRISEVSRGIVSSINGNADIYVTGGIIEADEYAYLGTTGTSYEDVSNLRLKGLKLGSNLTPLRLRHEDNFIISNCIIVQGTGAATNSPLPDCIITPDEGYKGIFCSNIIDGTQGNNVSLDIKNEQMAVGNLFLGSKIDRIEEPDGRAMLASNLVLQDSQGQARAEGFGTADPTTSPVGNWKKGDVVWNTDADSSEYIGWVFDGSGWNGFGVIS